MARQLLSNRTNNRASSNSFRFLGEIGRHLVGQDWRSYQSPIGPPIYYGGFSAKMIASVMSTPILQSRISELAHKRIAVEENEGLLNKNDRAYESKKTQRLGQIEESLREVCEKMVDGMICKMESNNFIRGAYYLCTELLTRAYHQGALTKPILICQWIGAN